MREVVVVSSHSSLDVGRGRDRDLAHDRSVRARDDEVLTAGAALTGHPEGPRSWMVAHTCTHTDTVRRSA